MVAIADVQVLLDDLTAPIGGLRSPDTHALVDTLQLLLAAPTSNQEEAP